MGGRRKFYQSDHHDHSDDSNLLKHHDNSDCNPLDDCSDDYSDDCNPFKD